MKVGYEYIDVTPCTEPDPDWAYVDRAGHEHRWIQKASGSGYALESLLLIIDMPATDNHPASSHLECPLCRERIIPGWRAVQFKQYMKVFI